MDVKIPDAFQRLFLSFGMVGPALYASVVFALGYLTPGYSQILDTMSELGASGAPYAIFMNVLGFFALGAMTIAFAAMLPSRLGSEGKARYVGAIFIALSGASVFSLGVFRCDPGCIDITPSGVYHDYFAMASAIFMMLGQQSLASHLRGINGGRGFVIYTRLSVLVMAALSLYFIDAIDSPYAGLVQRTLMGTGLLWMALLSASLLREREAKHINRPANINHGKALRESRDGVLSEVRPETMG